MFRVLHTDTIINCQVGDEIAIASTSFVPEQAEKRMITNVAGHVLTLDRALEFEHDYMIEAVSCRIYTRCIEMHNVINKFKDKATVDTQIGPIKIANNNSKFINTLDAITY